MEKVLVTGGSGFIGGSLSRGLLERGFRVRAYYRPGDDARLISSPAIEKIEGDICDIRLLSEAARGCACVFHTAGNVSFRRADRRLQYRVNVEGTRAVVAACRLAGVTRLVHTSTVNTLGIPSPDGAVGDENTTYTGETAWFGYARTKKVAEDTALAACGPSLDVVVVNPGTVFGPGDVNRNAGSYILAIARAPVLFYPEGGTNCVHIDAVVAGQVAAFEKGRSGERYILGGENLTYREIFSIIAGLLGRRAPRFRLPALPSMAAAAAIEIASSILGVRSRLALEAARASRIKFFYSSDKARRDLGLPSIPFRLAARDAIEWYRAQGYL
jgi:dihydroflavonol-4-reductase